MTTAEKRNDRTYIRISTDEKSTFREAADLIGVGLSEWIRMRLREAATKELREAGRVPAFAKRKRT